MNNENNEAKAVSINHPLSLVEKHEIEPPVFPLDALGELAGAAQAIHEHVQVAEGTAGMSVLLATALIAQAHIDVSIDGRRFPTSLFGMTVAESGDRKSQTDSFAMRAHRAWEEEKSKERAKKLKSQFAAQNKWLAAVEKLKSEFDEPDELEEELLELGPMPSVEPEPTLTVSSPTFEGLIRSYKVGIPYKGLFSDEGATFFGGHAMRQDGGVKATIAGLSKLWDGAAIQRTNAAEGESYALWSRRLSAHLMLQPVIAREVMSSVLLREQGFLPRFLLTWPKSYKGMRLYKGTNPLDDSRLQRYWQNMTSLLSLPAQTEEGGGLKTREVTLTEAARNKWIDAYNKIEVEIGVDGKYAEISAFGSKAAEIAARISGVLAFAEDPNVSEIHERHVDGGVAIVLHSLDTLVALANKDTVSPILLQCEKLKDWLLKRTENREGAVVTKTEILWNFRPKLSSSEVDRLTAILQAKGWLSEYSEGALFEGKLVKKAWKVFRPATVMAA